MSLVLVGYRGCGKTTIGQLLANRLGCVLVDTDSLIVASAGMTIKDIFARFGEPHFRTLESASLEQALHQPHSIISTGGGIVMSAGNRQKLRESGRPVIYLSCSAPVLLQRIQADTTTAANRPNLTALGGGLDEVQHMLSIREPFYREVATMVVDVTQQSAQQAAEEILKVVSR